MKTKAERDQMAEDAKAMYPSLAFGVDEWVAAFAVRVRLFEGILDDMAARVGVLRDNGMLTLDADGRETSRAACYGGSKSGRAA